MRSRCISYVFKWEKDGTVVKYTGDIDIGEVKRAQDELHGDPRVDGARYLIVDALAVTSINATRRDEIDIWAYDAGTSHRNPKLRKAFVATLDELVNFVNWYNSMHRAPYPSKIFDNEADARRWLELELQIPINTQQ